MTGHRDIPDEVVKRAQLYDREHFREDRAGERGGQWGSVPDDQVRRLLWGAYGGAVAAGEDRGDGEPLWAAAAQAAAEGRRGPLPRMPQVRPEPACEDGP